MNKITIIILLIVFIAAGFLFLRGDEDTWICEDGIWVKHGNPSTEVPTEPCDDGVVSNFEECVAQGNPVMESFPRQCRDSKTGNSFVEDIGLNGNASTTDPGEKFFCSADQREADVCIELYEPVCATVNIQCIKAPCDPIKETFSNSCIACINPLVESYTRGECEQ